MIRRRSYLVVRALLLSEYVACHHGVADYNEAARPERQLERRPVLVVVPSGEARRGVEVRVRRKVRVRVSN